jgi:hypothetical protein
MRFDGGWLVAGFEHYDRELRLALEGQEPEAQRRELAAFARTSVAELIASGQASPDYERFVNGRAGALEETVELPGPIVYVFTNWTLAIETALAELQKRVPRKSGRYARSFIVVVGGSEITDYDEIPPKAEVVILNFQPYTRKMEVGENGEAGDRHFDLARGAFNRRFSGAFRASVQFLNVTSGLRPDMPYILKRGGRSRRKDRQSGQAISYPALILSAI